MLKVWEQRQKDERKKKVVLNTKCCGKIKAKMESILGKLEKAKIQFARHLVDETPKIQHQKQLFVQKMEAVLAANGRREQQQKVVKAAAAPRLRAQTSPLKSHHQSLEP